MLRLGPKTIKKAASSALLLTVLFSVVLPFKVLATTLTESYISDKPIGIGTVVSLSKDKSNQIVSTTTTNDTAVIGVAAEDNSSIIDLQAKNSNIKIATSGETEILVTDLAGNIKTGDYLIISPLSGVAMKDEQGFTATKYVGVAQEDFSSKNTGTKQIEVEQSNGKKQKVNTGLIKAKVFITERPPQKSTKARSFLTTIGERIVGKPVSTIRVVTSVIILLSTLLVTGLMLNASIKGTFVSLGRNPLARSSIVANLMKLILVALIVFESGLVAAYLVLAL